MTWRDELADAQYQAHRSSRAALDVVTHHLEFYGDPVGFVSYRITAESLDAAEHLFVGIEYIHVDAGFQKEGWSRLLWQPIVQVVREKLAEGRAYTHLFSASTAESAAGLGVLKRFDQELRCLASGHEGLAFVGWLESGCSHPYIQ